MSLMTSLVDDMKFVVNVSCRPDMRAPVCGLCPKLQDQDACDKRNGCNRDFDEANNWCVGDDCYLDSFDGSCKEKSRFKFYFQFY